MNARPLGPDSIEYAERPESCARARCVRVRSAAERLARLVLDFDLHHVGMTNLAYTAELESLCIAAREVLGHK